MSQENGNNNGSNQPQSKATITRNADGSFKPGFNRQIEDAIKNVRTQPSQVSPTDTEYVKMNTILQKQSGISAEKFLEYQGKMNAKDLFDKLSFLAENIQPPQQTPKPATLPPNQPTVPISPGTQKVELPGTAIGTQNLTKDGFSIHLKLDSKKLLHPKKTK